ALDDGIVMRSEQKGKKSDGAKLTCNLLRWLSEPSQQMAGFGGYKPEPKKLVSWDNEPGFISVDWSKPLEFGPAFKNCYVGLIGARTALSTGEGSPEEFISAAKAAGYQFIAFCEDINSMSEKNWDKLVESCKKGSNSTNEFLAIPGMYYEDFNGSAFVVLGDIGYPPANWADPKNHAKKIRANDTIRMGAKWIPPIIMLPFKENTLPARLYATFYGYAGQVWEGNRLRIEDWDTYLQLEREDLMLFPTAVHIVRRPAEVADARRQGMQAFVRADSVSKLLESIDGLTSGRGRWFKPAFPSTGPEICAFYAVNWGTSDQARIGGDRFRIQMMARSEKGLAEVQLLDQGVPVRRFLLHGAKEFKKDIDEYHSGQHSYVLVVTDVEGGKAVSWSRVTQVQEYWHTMCSDNWNDMGPGGKQTLDRGVVPLLGTETTACPCWPLTVGIFPAFMGGGKAPDGSHLKGLGGFAAMKQSIMVGRFGGINEYSLDRRYEAGGQAGEALTFPILENPYFRGKLRCHTFRRIPPGADLMLVDYDFTLTQDIMLIGRPGLILAGGSATFLPGDNLSHLVYFTPQGDCVLEAPTTRSGNAIRNTTVKPGEYVGVFPQATGIFALDSELEASLWRFPKTPEPESNTPGTYLNVGIGKLGEILKAGTRVQKTLAVVALPLAAKGTYRWLPEYKAYENSNLLMVDVRRKMGLAGPPAYQVTPSVGAVENTRLVLRLKAEDYGFRGKISQCHLPLPLPVFIAPLNWRWSAGVWYKGKNKLLSVEWPPREEGGRNVHADYVLERERVDEIIRFGIFDTNTGYLQLDLEGGERDVFIGNLVTCDRAEFFLTLHRDLKSGKGSVEVHNPTDKAENVTVKPTKGFDLFGNFTRKIEVPAGTSVLVDISE
ncbi:MAG: hypothetical protein L6437_09625, partial [Kiritimatiellae bacterium]|nr:hypothetical protein [Kiritimatiellia bacterium]